jgi:Leucine-rich repeat (LRR) protein
LDINIIVDSKAPSACNVPRIFYKLNSLKRLDLSGNNLLVIDEEVFRDIRY